MILQILLAILGLLFSVWGLITFLLGFVTFLLLPMISTVSRFKGFSQFFLTLATFPLRRVAFVISESNEAYFKTLDLELGMLSTKLDGKLKMIEDPAQRLHHWMGIRLGLVWEENGVMFDPRDAAAGMRKHVIDETEDDEYLATNSEWDNFGVRLWKPAAFAMPTDYEIVDLSAVKELIDGGERAEYAKRVEEYYKHSRLFGSGTSISKYLYPIIGFSVPFFGIWVMVSQLGQPSSTVSFGLLWLLVSLSRPDIRAVNWRKVVGVTLLVGIPLAILVGLGLLIGPVLTIAATVIFILGMLVMPLLTILAQASDLLAGALSKLYFKLGFLGYRRPVFVWTPSKYELREYDALETTSQQQTAWYDLFGTVVGFSYIPEPESWGTKHLPHSEIESQVKDKREIFTDGGASRETNLPPKYIRSEQIKRDDMGGYLPKRPKDSKYYVHTGRVMQTFKNTANGEKALEKLLEAKEKHGKDGDGLDDGLVFKTTAVAGLLGALSGIGIFLLPALL